MVGLLERIVYISPRSWCKGEAMPSIFKQRQIIDRAKIIGDVDSLMSAGQSPKEIRQDFYVILNTALKQGL